MGKSEIWENKWEKFNRCEKRSKVLKKGDMWEKVRYVWQKVKHVRKSERSLKKARSIKKSEKCEKSEMWENNWEKYDNFDKKWEVWEKVSYAKN